MLKTKRVILTTFITAILLITLATTSVFAYVGYRLLSVTAYQQQTSSWCWAAATESVAKYFGANPSQTEIVTFVFGYPYPDAGETVYNIRSALGHWNINSTASSSSLSFGTVISYINNGQPIIAGNMGHAEVIRGYYEDTLNAIQDVYFIDPDDASYHIEEYSDYSAGWNGGSVYNIYVG